MYDVIIVGMGPSGMGASIYAKRSGLKTLLLDESAPGGLLNKISVVENYLGFKSLSGSELAFSMFEHVRNENVEYKIERVLKIENNNSCKKVITTKTSYETKNIILAIGRKPKKSEILNEEKFTGKGISYCAVCDAQLYKNKDILVLGEGNSAFEEALYLCDFAKKVTIVIRETIKAEEELVKEVKDKNIEIKSGLNAKEFLGEDIVSGIMFDDGSIINCDGVFIYYGYQADTAFIKDLNITDESGYIEVDKNMKTKKNGIYACGDIIKKDIYQIITAVSEGSIAALSIKRSMK